MSFIKELKSRNVFRVGIAYAVATWLLIQVADIVFPRIGLPDSAVTLVIALYLNEQDGPSLARLHVAAQTRESASLPRSPAARVGTSLCQVKVKS
jgi:hypothetical protein